MVDATIRDVARRAEVSVASVSRALNGLTNVHPDTRAKVFAAAKSLGYVPHAGARSLSMARTHAIGVVLPDLHGEFFSEIVRGLDREASARGYQLLLSNMHAEVERAGQAMRAMRGRVDGLVVMAPQIAPGELAETLPKSLPVVLINSPDGGERPAFRIGNRDGAAAMVDHLVDRGARALVHIAGPAGNLDARERCEGFAAGVARHDGVAGRVIAGNFSEQSGERAATMLLADDMTIEGAAIDAIFAANDMMALGAYQVLRAAGRSIPDAIALAGFDDVPIARFLSLTTMRVKMDEIGGRAAARLIDALEGRTGTVTTELIVPELIVRATT